MINRLAIRPSLQTLTRLAVGLGKKSIPSYIVRFTPKTVGVLSVGSPVHNMTKRI